MSRTVCITVLPLVNFMIKSMRFFLSLSMLIIISMLVGCTEIAEPAMAEASLQPTAEDVTDYPVTVEGLVFSASPKSVASLSPALTEIIAELGFSDRLVCRNTYCDYPEEITSLPAVGSSVNPDIDAISEYNPRLLVSLTPIANKDILTLEANGTSVMILDAPKNNEELYDLYEKLAMIFCGQLEYAEAAENALRDYREAIESADSSCESILLILEEFGDTYSVATGSSFAGNYISCFGENVALSVDSAQMTASEIIAADPQVILYAYDNTDLSPLSETSAYQNGWIYHIDSTLIERPTSRLKNLTTEITEKLRCIAEQ